MPKVLEQLPCDRQRYILHDLAANARYAVVHLSMNAPILIFSIGFLSCFAANYFIPIVHQWFWIPLSLLWLIGAVALKRAFDTSESDDSESTDMSKVYFALIAAPFIVALSMTINGLFDSSPPLSLPGIVASVSSGRMGNSLLVETAQGSRDVLVNGDCYRAIAVGRKVTVLQRAGTLGVTWIEGIAECHADRRMQEGLPPTATQIQNLCVSVPLW